MSISIAILAPSPVPFQIGGAEKFWMGLQRGIMDCSGHFVELLKLPSREDTFEQLIDTYRLFSELDLTHFDMVITTKYPAWMVRHFNHVLYLQHPLRGLYDTYHFTGLPETLEHVPAPLRSLMSFVREKNPTTSDLHAVFELAKKALATKSLPSSLFAFPGPLIREVVHFFDRAAMHPSRVASYFAISETVKNRKDYLPDGINATVLHHPPEISSFFNAAGRYIFTASRLNAMKRLKLVVKAMAYVHENLPLKIAGTGPELESLKKMSESDRRIEFLGHVPDADLAGLYSEAVCVPFVPYDEDYGLITIEAMKSGKPVVTTNDAGGVLEFVENGITGFHVEPEPAAIGGALEKLASDRSLAARMGAAARKKVESITWNRVTSTIFFHNAAGTVTEGPRRPRVVVCAPFRASRHGVGGQRRLYHMCATLAENYDVVLICPAEWDAKVAQSHMILRGLREFSIPWMSSALDDAESLRGITGESADDMALMRCCATHGLMLDAIAAECRDCVCVIASHPWLFPAIAKAACNVPLIYDAHNVEADIKGWMFAEKRPDLLANVRATEGNCCRAAAFVSTCCPQDADRLARLYGLDKNKFLLAPNGCDTGELKFTGMAGRRKLRQQHPFPEEKLILFLGSGHKPNVEAVEFIMKIAQDIGEAQFLIGGSAGLQPEIRALKKPENVHLLGTLSEEVKNLLLRMADIAINPISSGSGTNLKLMEYILAGIPAISTPFGSRGLEGDFTGVLHICELEQFPITISNILQKTDSGHEAEKKCHALAEKYSWRSTMQKIIPAIASVANNAPNHAG